MTPIKILGVFELVSYSAGPILHRCLEYRFEPTESWGGSVLDLVVVLPFEIGMIRLEERKEAERRPTTRSTNDATRSTNDATRSTTDATRSTNDATRSTLWRKRYERGLIAILNYHSHHHSNQECPADDKPHPKHAKLIYPEYAQVHPSPPSTASEELEKLTSERRR